MSGIRNKISPVKVLVIYFVVILIGALSVSAGINPMLYGRVVTIYTEDGTFDVKTNKSLVAEILEEANIPIDEDYHRTLPSLYKELESDYIVVDRAKLVVLNLDGQEQEVISWAKTFEDFLVEQDITIAGDVVHYSLEEGFWAGKRIEIIRVNDEVAIAADKIYKNDSSLALGKEKVETKAQDGMTKTIYEVIYNDGIEVTLSIVEVVVVDPVTGIILKGTKPAESRSVSSVVTGIASYYGSYFHGRLTASGVPFDMYAMTAAHKTLRFGTKVRVTYLKTGKSVIVEINDRGPFIPGRIIDLSTAAAKEIGLFADGIGNVKVEILD